MGWLFTLGQSRKDLVRERTSDWENKPQDDGTIVSGKCIKHCFRGNVNFSGVLWTVWEVSFVKDGKDVKHKKRYIGCDLLKYQNNYGWGYKDMSESCFPYYFSCPLGYLNIVPCANVQWRIAVWAYHIRKKKEREARKAAKKAMGPMIIYT